MPSVTSRVVVAVSPDVAFAVSQTTGAIRLRWDPFIREQYFLDGALAPARGVRTYTRSRHRVSMVSRYVSFKPGSNVGMTMESGPWFFAVFGGGWRFEPVAEGTLAVWKYTFTGRPRWLQPVTHRVGTVVLQRDIDRRIAAFARACTDPVVLGAVEQA